MEGVDSDGAPVLLVDLGGMLFTFDYEHRLNVLGDCLARPPDASTQLGCTFGGINPYHCGAWFAS